MSDPACKIFGAVTQHGVPFAPGVRVRVVNPTSSFAGRTGAYLGLVGYGVVDVRLDGDRRPLAFGASEIARAF